MAKRRLCLGPTGVINCTPLATLSFWVSLFPGMHGYNNWIHGYGTCRYEGLTVYYTTKIPKATSWQHSTGLIQQVRNRGLERSSDLPKVTLLVQGQGRSCDCSYTARLSPCRPTGKQAVEWHRVGRSNGAKLGRRLRCQAESGLQSAVMRNLWGFKSMGVTWPELFSQINLVKQGGLDRWEAGNRGTTHHLFNQDLLST